MEKITSGSTGLVNKNCTSEDLNKVEYDTIMFPTLIAKKKIKKIMEMNSCRRKSPILMFTKTYSITFFAK